MKKILMNIWDLKKWILVFEWIFWILKKWIFFWMNILDFKKMNILFEWIFWIFIKWIMFWTNILVLVCLRQKWLSPNVSNSSEITHGSLVGPISVHFSGLLPILGPQEGSAAITWPHLGILNNFPHFFWMNNSIEYSGLYWMNIFLNEYFGFCFELSFELNHF